MKKRSIDWFLLAVVGVLLAAAIGLFLFQKAKKTIDQTEELNQESQNIVIVSSYKPSILGCNFIEDFVINLPTSSFEDIQDTTQGNLVVEITDNLNDEIIKELEQLQPNENLHYFFIDYSTDTQYTIRNFLKIDKVVHLPFKVVRWEKGGYITPEDYKTTKINLNKDLNPVATTDMFSKTFTLQDTGFSSSSPSVPYTYIDYFPFSYFIALDTPNKQALVYNLDTQNYSICSYNINAPVTCLNVTFVVPGDNPGYILIKDKCRNYILTYLDYKGFSGDVYVAGPLVLYKSGNEYYMFDSDLPLESTSDYFSITFSGTNVVITTYNLPMAYSIPQGIVVEPALSKGRGFFSS
jgi:hypothetical protein